MSSRSARLTNKASGVVYAHGQHPKQILQPAWTRLLKDRQAVPCPQATAQRLSVRFEREACNIHKTLLQLKGVQNILQPCHYMMLCCQLTASKGSASRPAKPLHEWKQVMTATHGNPMLEGHTPVYGIVDRKRRYCKIEHRLTSTSVNRPSDRWLYRDNL